jgi:hypothetical protein
MSPRGWDSRGEPIGGHATRDEVVAGAAQRWGIIEKLSQHVRIPCCEKLSRGRGPCPYNAKWRLQGREYCNWHVPVGGWVAREMLNRQRSAS